tara:strand:- start:1206 stop:2726 length:1521 start_codon:yes stop_codon:yes gene_type:complete
MLESVMEDDAKVIRGRDAQRLIVDTAMEVAARVKSTLGPKGMDKLLADKMGQHLLSNDGATILKMSNFSNSPIATIMIESAKSQEDTAFDGTTSTVIITHELLEKADPLIQQGVHPNEIASGYKEAERIAMEGLKEIASDGDPYESAKKVAETAMTGKSAQSYKVMLSEICAKAASIASPKNIKIIGRPGHPEDAELIEGVYVQKKNSYQTEEKEVEGKILLLDEELAPPQANVTLHDPNKIREISAVQQKYIEDRLKHIDGLEICAIFCQKGVDSRAIAHFRKKGIVCVRNATKSDILRIAKATGGEVVADLSNLTVEELGQGRVALRGIESGPNPFITVTGVKEGVASIIMPAPTEQAAAEFNRALDDALGVAYITYKSPQTVPGAGSIQSRLADRIRNSELMEDSKAEAAKQAFAECLLAIPQTLAESAGMDTIDALAALRREPHLGVNVYEKRITEMDDVREPYLMTKASINAAVETAITLLRTDEVILSKPIQETFVDDML